MSVVRDIALPSYLGAEMARVTARVSEARRPEDVLLLVVSDVHRHKGDSWPMTLQCMHACCEELTPDAIVQLGDLIDGDLPREVSSRIATETLSELRGLGAPLYGCVGNHDFNAELDPGQAFDTRECARLFLQREAPDYHVDLSGKDLRLVFLHSYDPSRANPFGFSRDAVSTLRDALASLPEKSRVLVFSHMTPAAEIHQWSESVERGKRVMAVLDKFARRHPNRVLAHVVGHSHADLVYMMHEYPIVSIAAAKTSERDESYHLWGHKPARVPETTSEVLFDLVIVKASEPTLEFVRFGAGEDRSVRA